MSTSSIASAMNAMRRSSRMVAIPFSVTRIGIRPRELEELVVDLRLDLEARVPRLRAVLVLKVGDGERDSDRRLRVRLDRGRGEPVSFEEIVRRAPCGALVALHARRIDAQHVAAPAETLGLVDGARVADHVAECASRALAVAFEQPGEARVREPSQLVDPQRQREVMEGEDRSHAVLEAGLEHPPVVVELGCRELAIGRLDPRPLDPKPEGVEAEPREHRDVVAVAVVEIARVAGRLDAGRAFAVLPPPPVRVRVAALDLVRADRGAEKETLGEGGGHSTAVFHTWGR